MITYYTSDTHFGHHNIIEYTGRPFKSVEQMDAALISPWAYLLFPGTRLVHGGDVAFYKSAALPNELPQAADNILVAGNHDRKVERFRGLFNTIVGTHRTWETNTIQLDDMAFGRAVRVLVSHRPQEDLQGCDYNLYGHVHERPLVDHPRHLCICVETTNYWPMTLEQLLSRIG